MSRERSSMAVGFTYFAAVIMMLAGVFNIIEGLAGVVHNDFYTITSNYVFHFNASAWGWINLLVGVVVLLAAYGLFTGAIWARTVGVIMAAITALDGFAFIPVYPLWGITLVTLSVLVIWALTMHGRDVTTDA
jgi:dolichyl-phosphate-mannose--protein O-mannosyl transferase